jgi:hypothetical protein
MSEDLEIIPELRDLIPPLKDYELEQLRRSLDASGFARDELVVWKQRNAILDGHNRYEWCKQKGYDFRVRRISVFTMEEAKRFIILNQLGRRNVDDKTVSILRGQLYNSEKKEPTIQQAGPGRGNKTGGNCCPPLSTAEKVAAQTGVSPRTVKNDAKFAQAAEEIGATADIVAGKDKRTRKEIVEAAETKKNGGEPRSAPVTIRARKPKVGGAPFKTPFNKRFKESWAQFLSNFWGDEIEQAIGMIVEEYGK